MATELMASREKSETDFRQNMFTNLIAQILSHKSSLRDRYASFELFQNNFNDLFNSRSLYDVLWFASLEQLHDTRGKKSVTPEDSAEARSVMLQLVLLARYTN